MESKELANKLDQISSIPGAFLAQAIAQPDQVVFRSPTFDGNSYLECSRALLKQRVAALGLKLQQVGITKGDRVAIISNTRPEWMLADLAIQAIGAVTVSVYQTLPADDIGYILYDSNTKFIFAENQEQVDKIYQLASSDITIPAVEDRAEHSVRISYAEVFTFESVESPIKTELLSYSELEQIDSSGFKLAELGRNDLATLVYTSGTTGPAKGVMQTHGNHLSNVRQVVNSGLIQGFPSIMLFLPLAHSFARLMGYLGLLTPVQLKFPRVSDRKTSKLDLNQVTADIRTAGAAILPLVPRVLEKMQSGVVEHTSKPGLKNYLVRQAIKAAVEKHRLQAEGKAAGILVNMIYEGSAAIRSMIKTQLFGANFRYVVSGGAKLNPEVARFFEALGMEILEGYGLTETCVATNINPVGRNRISTVGPVLDQDIELQLTEEGEILFRGPNVSSGYLNRPQATKSAWDNEGWFHTGDLGKLDAEGYLSIVGRKKEIIVNSYGKNISCLNVEQALTSSEFITQAVLIGEARPYCVALLVPDQRALKIWAQKRSLVFSGIEQAEVRELLDTEVKRVNEHLASFEEIKKFILLPEEFSVENGLLTPTLKTKRNLIEKRYADLIAGLY